MKSENNEISVSFLCAFLVVSVLLARRWRDQIGCATQGIEMGRNIAFFGSLDLQRNFFFVSTFLFISPVCVYLHRANELI